MVIRQKKDLRPLPQVIQAIVCVTSYITDVRASHTDTRQLKIIVSQ